MGTLASELAPHAERLTPRPRVYADANVPAGLVAHMRSTLGWDVLFVIEEASLRRAAAQDRSDHHRSNQDSAIHNLGAPWTRPHCGGGLFAHVMLPMVEDLSKFARESDQTVGHFGLEAAELNAAGRILARAGVDRLVPIGEALAFESTWDGGDLIGDFLRYCTVR